MLNKKYYILFILYTLFLLNCETYKWVTLLEEAKISELSQIDSIGIALFQTNFVQNEHPLIKTAGSDYYLPIEITGIANKVNVVVLAPNAISDFFVNQDNMGKLVQDIIKNILSGKTTFDFYAIREFNMQRFMSKSEDGKKAGVYKKVIALNEKIQIDTEEQGIIKMLGKKYGVAVILAGKIQIYAEILKTTAQIKDNPGIETSYDQGKYLLFLRHSLEFTLYDTQTGKVITNKYMLHPQYIKENKKQHWIIPLSISSDSDNDLFQYLNGNSFLELFLEPITQEALGYAHLFLPHYRSYREIVEE